MAPSVTLISYTKFIHVNISMSRKGCKIPCLSIFSITYLHLPLFPYILPNIALIALIWSYLPLIALILPYVPYSPQIDILLLRLHLCAICLEQSDNYSWIYCISKYWGILKVLSRMQFICLSSHCQCCVCTF